MTEGKKQRLHQFISTQRETQFEKLWNAPSSEYARTREITEFILCHGSCRQELLPLPSNDLVVLIKLLSKAFYLGKKSEKLGEGKSLVEGFLSNRGYALPPFYTWCKESGITSEGQFFGLLLDVWGCVKDRQCG